MDDQQTSEEVAPNRAFISVSAEVSPQVVAAEEDGRMPERTLLGLFPTYLRFGSGGSLEHPYLRVLGEACPLVTMVVKG